MATWKKVVVSGSDGHLHNITASNNVVVSGSVEILGDLTVTGDDITMGTNTSGHILVADGTNFNPVASSGDATIAANGAISLADNSVDSAEIAAGAIDTEHIGNEQVTLAKLAHAAANTVLVRDANSAGDPSFKAVTNEQILIGDGTGFTAAALSGDATMGNNGAVTLAAAQTNVNSILATDLVLGEDSQTKIDFETANEIHFDAANAQVMNISDRSVNVDGGAITSSGDISSSADLYGTNLYGADAVYHDNDANTGILFSSDTIAFRANNEVSAQFASTGGNSLGNASYRTSLTGSQILLNSAEILAQGAITSSGVISASAGLIGDLTGTASVATSVVRTVASLTDGNGIADFTFNGSSAATVTVDLDGSTLSLGSAGVKVSDGGVDTTQLADDAVDANKLAANAVVNDSVADGAAIAFSKLAELESTTILVGSSGNVATSRAVSGDATLSNTGVLTLASSLTSVGSILKTDLVLGEDSQTKIDFETANEIHFDADNAQVMNISDRSVNVNGGAITSSGVISGSAGFIGDLTGTASFVSSLAGAGITNGKFLVGDSNGDAAEVNMSGDATMNNAGAVTIANNAVETVMIADEQVTLAKLAHAAANTVLVRDANSAGDPSFKAVTNEQILIGDGTGFTAAALSGDATMGNNGAVTLAAAQTNITSILATDLVLGEDSQTKIDFETANEIHFYANNVEQVYVADNIFGPQSDSDVDLGSNGVRWKDAYVDSLTVTADIAAANAVFSGNLTVQGDLTSIQATSLNVEDKMIVLASGSTAEADSGLIVQSTATAGHGFGFDASLGRWVVESGSLVSATAWGAKGATEYMAIVSASAADPTAAPFYGGTSTGHGNFAVNTSDETFWVYV